MSAFDDFLDAPNAARCWLLELEAFPLAPLPAGSPAMTYAEAAYSELSYSEGSGGGEGAVVTLYYSDRGFTSKSTDTPANFHYEPRLRPDIRVERRIVGKDGIGGLSRVFAEVALVNRDGGLDTLKRDYAIEGRAARLYVGPPGGARADFGLVASATTERVWTDFQSMRVDLSDGLAKLNRNLNTTTYTGTGSIEGGADLKGKYKPKAYGKSHNLAPPLVNSALLIFQVHDGVMNDVTAVYDRGISLTKGADYTSQSDLETNAPSAGQYRVWKGGGFFRLGSTPAGTVTADVEGDATPSYVTKAGEIVKRILEAQAEFAAGDIDSTSFTTLNTAAPQPVGIWAGTEGRKIDDCADELLFGIGAFGGFSRQGQFTVGVVSVPSASASAATFTSEKVFEIQRLPLPPELDPMAWRVRVGWQRNYTVQTDLASGVTAARRTFAAEPIRYEKDDDSSLLSRHRLAKEYQVDANFRDQADALAEAQRLLDMWGVERGMFLVTVPPQALARDLGDVITIVHPRHGMSAGVEARVLGHAIQGPSVQLTVLT